MATAMHSARLERAELGERAVVATLDRAEIERARNDGTSELVLELAHADRGVATLAMSWNPADLEALLAEDADGPVTIAFDRGELEAWLDHEDDVEAHGLRRRALVFTVVLGSMVAAPAVAQAHPTGSPNSPAASNVAPAVLVGGATAQAPDATYAGTFNPATTVGGATTPAMETTYAANFNPATTVGGASAAVEASTPTVSPALMVGGAHPAVEASTRTTTPAVTVGGAIPAATDASSPASLVGGGGFNAPDPSSPAVMVGGGAPATPAPATATPATTEVASSSSIFDGGPDPALLVGGAAIAITAAGFAAASTSRRRPMRPA